MASEHDWALDDEDLLVIQYTSRLVMAPEAVNSAMKAIIDHAQKQNIAKGITGLVVLNESTNQAAVVCRKGF